MPIIAAVVAAAARIGMPHHAFSAGTCRIPPPIPSRPESTPPENEMPSAAGSRRIR